MSKVLAIEGQPYGIRVSVVSPGGVLTNLSKELLATRDPSEATEWMTPDEVAETVLFIAQQDGSAATDEIVLRRYASEPWRQAHCFLPSGELQPMLQITVLENNRGFAKTVQQKTILGNCEYSILNL